MKKIKNNPLLLALAAVVAFMIFAIVKFYTTGKWPFE